MHAFDNAWSRRYKAFGNTEMHMAYMVHGLLVVSGIIAALVALDVLPMEPYTKVWGTLLIAWGIIGLVQTARGKQFF